MRSLTSFIVILDFTTTLGLDSSAAQSIAKLKVNCSIYVGLHLSYGGAALKLYIGVSLLRANQL